MTFEERKEAAARAIAPLAWAALGTGDTIAQANRRKASLRHAEAALIAACPELRHDQRNEAIERVVGKWDAF